jgi:hypothetical protein
MTAAQKSAKEKFKKAIAYRQKTGCTLKEAFASVYGKKTAAKKTAAKKTAVKKTAVKKSAVKKVGSVTSKNAKQLILDSIDGSDYGVITNTDAQKIKFLKDTFESEYGWAVSRMGKQKAIEEWLRGIPSAITLPFYNDDILEVAKKWGTLSKNPTEKEEDKILNNYWKLMASQILQLFNKTKSSVGDFNKNKALFVEAKTPVKPRKKRKKSANVWSVSRLKNGRFKKRGIKNLERESYSEKVAGIGAVNSLALKNYEDVTKKIVKIEKYILDYIKSSKNLNFNLNDRKGFKDAAIKSKKYLSELKKQKSELKKLL